MRKHTCLRQKRKPRRLTSVGVGCFAVMLMYSVLPLPFAFSFVAGSYAGVSATKQLIPTTKAPKHHPFNHPVIGTQQASTSNSVAEQVIEQSSLKTEDSWKGGEVTASIIGRLFYQYAFPLLKLASTRALDANDCFDLPVSYKMDSSVPSLSHIYNNLEADSRKQIEETKLRGESNAVASQSFLLTKALILEQQQSLVRTGILRLVNTAIQALPAVLVSRLLRLVEAGGSQPASKSVMAALMLVSVLSIKMVTENKFFHETVKCSTQVRGALAGMIFDKSLRLPGGGSGISTSDNAKKSSNESGAGSSIGAGGVMNLMQSDTSLIESASLQIHTLWDGPLQIAVYTSLLYRYLGPPVFWGIGVLLLTIPTNSVVLRILNRLSKVENEAKDARTKRTTESIRNMKLLKLQSWESCFADDVRHWRTQELQRHVARGGIRALNQAISNAVPALVLVVTLTAYMRTGKPLLASTIFTAISLFNQLRFPLFFYPMLIDSLANGKNAMRRVSSYLASEEVMPYVQHIASTNGSGSIQMSNGNFLWSVLKETGNEIPVAPALRNVQLTVGPGEIVAVVGEVGTGKSALITALLGELNPVPRDVVQKALNVTELRDKTRRNADVGCALAPPSVVVHGRIAYCSQEPWLPKGSIREAIIFGREFDEGRYSAAIHDACLDLDIMNGSGNSQEDGALRHDTDVGEGGQALSGGQRARVALARALYSDDGTAVFLLDDVLSALDARVRSLVFERLTKRLKCSNAATLFVTNDPSISRTCDRVVLMGKVPGSDSCSQVIDVGTYSELVARGHEIRLSNSDTPVDNEEEYNDDQEDLIQHQSNYKLGNVQVGPPKLMKIRKDKISIVGGNEVQFNCSGSFCHADPETQLALENCPDLIADRFAPTLSEVDDSVTSFPSEIFLSNLTAESKYHSMGTVSQLTSRQEVVAAPPPKSKVLASADDSMSTGAVTMEVYRSYLNAVRQPLLILAMVASYMMTNGVQFYQQLTVASWTQSGAVAAAADPYMRSLVNAAAVISVFLWLRSFVTLQVGVRASAYLHSKMLDSVFAAPMSFFDATDSGQLLSRFGKEMETIDRGVPDSIGSTLFCFLQIFMSMVGLASVVTPTMLLPLALVGYLYVKAMSVFRPAARDLKRAETKTRSPIYTHFGEAIKGSEIIRSFNQQRNWSVNHRKRSDQNLSVFFTIKALDRWLSTRLETLGNVVVLTAAIASVLLTRTGRLNAGSAGWGLTQALSITGLLTWAVRCLTDLETNMLSVIRVEELTNIDVGQNQYASGMGCGTKQASSREALYPLLPIGSSFNASLASSGSSALVHNGWPWRGNVLFKNVSMRYNPASPLVLDNVSLTIPAGTTLGVVGRTGSGKSSLLLTLFRIVEIEGGSIEIDGVDIRSIHIDAIRKSLAIIPQDPVLFAGTLGYNLDATGHAPMDAMWEALEAASPSLARQFRSGVGLDTQIAESGSNLSVGQRQLICLARALLRKSKILVLDEATSSVDMKTDADVQRTIQREFVAKGVTVITVAHRLDTVLGYDMIAVLGEGRVLEFGSPSELLRTRSELFNLVEADRQSKHRAPSS